MEIALTEDQQKAFDYIKEFWKDDDRQLCILDGAAGTGKTTLLKFIMSFLPTKVVVCAPTNKAVSVLRSKGFRKATTLDKVLNKSIYDPIQRKPTADEILYHQEHDMELPEFMVEERYEKIDADADGVLVCLDESSMTNKAEVNKLLALYPKVIAVGDAFQLPPVEGETWFQTTEPDITLSEIVRTGPGSEITKLANMVRNHSNAWKKANWQNEVVILDRSNREAVRQAMKEADITLAHKNSTCDERNMIIREMKGLESELDCYAPQPGDNLLSWQTIKASHVMKSEIYPVLKSYPLNGGYRVQMDIPNNTKDEFFAISKANLREQKTDIVVGHMYKFSFAEAITGHKSQGSEWNRVVVLAYDYANKFDGKWNWLYTCTTRAKQHLTVVI